MRIKRPRVQMLLLYLALGPSITCAQTYTVLHAFAGGYDGAALWGSLLLDARGNVYGTTFTGGPYGGGTVFELSPQLGGSWAYSLVAAFSSAAGPAGSTAGLTFDQAGNLYGATGYGGVSTAGTVFELKRSQGWALNVLYDFPLPGGGCCPYGGVAIDKTGNLFGNADWAFELSPGPSGWTATILHEFQEGSGDAIGALGAPILDANGNVYGITENGGANGHGAVYMLHPTSTGWQEYLLHNFPAATYDGQKGSLGALAMDASGALYGTTTKAAGTPVWMWAAESSSSWRASPRASGSTRFSTTSRVASPGPAPVRGWCSTSRATSTEPPSTAARTLAAAEWRTSSRRPRPAPGRTPFYTTSSAPTAPNRTLTW